jgi:hypothetical protein
MNGEPQQQITLQPTRGMVIAIAIILGIGLLGEQREAERMVDGDRAGLAFGTWTGPDIDPLSGNPIRCPELGIAIDPLDGYRFYRVDRPDDGREAPLISFINRGALLVGRIRTFDPRTDSWPPAADQFGHPPVDDGGPTQSTAPRRSQTQGSTAETEAGDQAVSIGLLTAGRPRIQVQTIRYSKATVVWASPRKSPAWPLRVHLGKCQLGERMLLLSLYELNAKRPEIDYSDGLPAEVVSALHPL